MVLDRGPPCRRSNPNNSTHRTRGTVAVWSAMSTCDECFSAAICCDSDCREATDVSFVARMRSMSATSFAFCASSDWMRARTSSMAGITSVACASVRLMRCCSSAALGGGGGAGVTGVWGGGWPNPATRCERQPNATHP